MMAVMVASEGGHEKLGWEWKRIIWMIFKYLFLNQMAWENTQHNSTHNINSRYM
jgi:hypothetical protein